MKGIIVSGWRGPLGKRQIADVRTVLGLHLPDFDVLYEGDAAGVDRVARDLAMSKKVHVKSFRANWAGLGRGAGPERNGRMLRAAIQSCDVLEVAAFPHPTASRGTWDLLKHAVLLGVDCRVFPLTIYDDDEPQQRLNLKGL